MWELVMRDAQGNAVAYWCKSIDAALRRAGAYCATVGGVREILIRPGMKGGDDDRSAA